MIGLLDTHSFLWAVVSPERLSANMRLAISDPAIEIYVSTISLWEIAINFSGSKLDMEGGSPDDLVGAASQMGLAISAPTAEESARYHHLPRVAHKDPFDRMLIWQCFQRRWTLVTRDRGLADYRAFGLHTSW